MSCPCCTSKGERRPTFDMKSVTKRQRPKREFNILTSGQFCNIAMFESLGSERCILESTLLSWPGQRPVQATAEAGRGEITLTRVLGVQLSRQVKSGWRQP